MIPVKFLYGNVLLGGELQIDAKNSNFWERPLYEISEYAFNGTTWVLEYKIAQWIKTANFKQLLWVKSNLIIWTWESTGRSHYCLDVWETI